MTDIEQQIAAAAETRASTAILADPAQVTEPLQILPFVTSFFRTYSPANRAKLLKAYSDAKYRFARMLIIFTDPPDFGAIMNNGDYYTHWQQSLARTAAWFETLDASLPGADAAARDGFQQEVDRMIQQMVNDGLLQRPLEPGLGASIRREVVVGFMVRQMFELLDTQYRTFTNDWIKTQGQTIHTLDATTRADQMGWITRMDDFLRSRAPGTTTTSVLDSVRSFFRTVMSSTTHFAFIGAPAPADPMPIGVDVHAKSASTTSATGPTKFVTLGDLPSAAGSRRTTRASTPLSDAAAAERERVAAARDDAVTNEARANSVEAHYAHLIKTFGEYMLQLFHSFNFPPIFALEHQPEFSVTWTGYIELAHATFLELSEARFAHFHDERRGARLAPAWSLEEIMADEKSAALFAEFVGYKKAVPQHAVAPGPYVQRTNATYHYARENMTQRFVALYNYILHKDLNSAAKKRRTLFVFL